MKGKDRFSRSEADEIRQLLDLVRRAEPGQPQKLLRDRLRAMGFYISDFARGPAGFTRSDFDDLVRDGRVTIIERPPAGTADPPRSAKRPRPRRTARDREGIPPSSLAERTRRHYRPDEVRVLFIGESPPAGGTFFYYANSKLYDATREAFEAGIPALRRRDDFLDAFKRLGCYLEDLSPVPVNHLDLKDREQRRQRRTLRAEGIKPLARRMRPWSPLVVAPVVLDMVKTGDITETLRLAGHADAERADLPFPGRHRDRYVHEFWGWSASHPQKPQISAAYPRSSGALESPEPRSWSGFAVGELLNRTQEANHAGAGLASDAGARTAPTPRQHARARGR